LKAHYKTRNGRMVFEVQAESQKGLFCAIAEVQDVFETDDTCGCCHSDNLRFCVRRVADGSNYYELRCIECGAALHFGQHRTGGTLFVKRTDERKELLPNRGWVKFQRLAAGESKAPKESGPIASSGTGVLVQPLKKPVI
jgi:hypothetical protein